MTDFDLDRLGDVWRQQPDPEEMERLQRTAGAVSRRARWGQVVDIGAAIAVAAVVILLVLSNPRTATVLMGAAAILVLLVSNIRLRKLRQVELRGLTGTTEEMLEQSIDRVASTLRYQIFSLIASGPAVLIGYLAASATQRSVGSIMSSLSGVPRFGILWAGAWVVAFAGIALFGILSIRRTRGELGRLTAMREAYRQEGESAAP